jgi:sulfatase maturation enzyme AslB (radical SAM superfamily)
MDRRAKWPLPQRVAAYGSAEEFRRARMESGQWVFWKDRVELVLQGRYDEVLPLHVELSPTYLCNFACPWCSCRSAREEWSDTDVFNHPRASPMTVMRQEKIDHILAHLAEYAIGIMWVGGEPTMNPLLYPAALKADQLGLPQCLFTNGSLFNPERVIQLFNANLVFIRVSLNAVTPEVHRIHHDYEARYAYGARVIENLRCLTEVRAQHRSGTLLGVSVVVDERNLVDLEPTARQLCLLAAKYGPGSIDYVIFRPAFPFYSAQLTMRSDTTQRFLEAIGPGAPWRRRLADSGIDVIIPDDSVAAGVPTDPASVHDNLGCLAAGWFGEITPNGDMVVCSDRYGNPDYFIGNIALKSIDELWAGPGRRRVLELARTCNCYPTFCPSNGRGHFFNRLFREVEVFRRDGRLAEVRSWVEDLREVLPQPTHSFFL